MRPIHPAQSSWPEYTEQYSCRIAIVDSGYLNTSVYGEDYNAGDVMIVARDSSISSSSIRTLTLSNGRGGNIIIDTGSLEMNRSYMESLTSGSGNAGNVKISARSGIQLTDSSIETAATSDYSLSRPRGDAGNIDIDTGSLVLRGSLSFSGSSLSSRTRGGTGNAGHVTIKANEHVLLKQSSEINTSSFTYGYVPKGNGGNISIDSANLAIIGGSLLDAGSSLGPNDRDDQDRPEFTGNAGNVTIKAREKVLLSGDENDDSPFPLLGEVAAGIYTGTYDNWRGGGGNVIIDANILELRNNAAINSRANGKENAGFIKISADDRLTISTNSSIQSTAEASSVGKGGDITIDGGTIEVVSGGYIAAVSGGKADSGKVSITARNEVLLDGVSPAKSNFYQYTVRGPYIDRYYVDGYYQDGYYVDGYYQDGYYVDAIYVDGYYVDDGYFQDGNYVDARYYVDSYYIADGFYVDGYYQDGYYVDGYYRDGYYAGGYYDDSIISGYYTDGQPSGIFTSNKGLAPLSVRGGDGFLSPNNQLGLDIGQGGSGSISINTPQLTVRDGAIIDARTVNAKPGGDITLNLENLSLLSGGEILSTAEGNGSAGTIRINAADTIRIEGTDPRFAARDYAVPRLSYGDPVTANSGIYVRSSNTGNGAAGNLILNALRLHLNDQAEIVADSNVVSGGNITINAPQSLIMRNGSLISATAGRADGAGDGGNIIINSPIVLSVPGENNDIIANAFSGTGGRITIDANAILNFTLNDQGKTFDQLRSQPTNDISASSQYGSNGTLNLIGFNTNPSQGATQLPTTTTIPQPTQGCQSNSPRTQSEFFTSGRGGQRQTPEDPLSAMEILDDLRIPAGVITSKTIAQIPDQPHLILEATHWTIAPSGKISITANATTNIPATHCRLYRQEQ